MSHNKDHKSPTSKQDLGEASAPSDTNPANMNSQEPSSPWTICHDLNSTSEIDRVIKQLYCADGPEPSTVFCNPSMLWPAGLKEINEYETVAWYYISKAIETIVNRRYKVSEAHTAFFQYLLQQRRIVQEGQRHHQTPIWHSPGSLAQVAQKIIKERRKDEAHPWKLLRLLATNLVEILTGKLGPVKAIIKHDLAFEYCSLATWSQLPMVQLAHQITWRYKSNPSVKILDLTSGLGATARWILAALHAENGNSPSAVSYTYTSEEVDKDHLEDEKKQLKAYGTAIEFRELRLDVDIEKQGFGADYDIVIANNNLHRWKDVRAAMANLRKLFRPDSTGELFFIEITDELYLFSLLFGMCDQVGWHFPDDTRPYPPTLSPEQWEKLLRETGFGYFHQFGIEDGDIYPAVQLMSAETVEPATTTPSAAASTSGQMVTPTPITVVNAGNSWGYDVVTLSLGMTEPLLLRQAVELPASGRVAPDQTLLILAFDGRLFSRGPLTALTRLLTWAKGGVLVSADGVFGELLADMEQMIRVATGKRRFAQVMLEEVNWAAWARTVEITEKYVAEGGSGELQYLITKEGLVKSHPL